MSLYWEEAGEGPVVVLIHAGVCDSRMWEPQWNELAATHRTIRMDLEGYGRSPLSGPRRSFAGGVAELLGTLGIEDAVLIGCSVGGQIALEVALASPKVARALILVGSGLPEHERSEVMLAFDAREAAAMERGDIAAAVRVSLDLWVAGPGRSIETVDPAIGEAVTEMLTHAYGLHGSVEIEDELLVPDMRRRLGEVDVPALVVVGEHDVVDMQTIANQLAAALPQSRKVVVDGTAHMVTMERTPEFNRLAREFIAGLPA